MERGEGLTVEQAHELVGGHARANLDADGVTDPAEVLDVSARELARAVTDPEEMRGGVIKPFCFLAVVLVGGRVARHGTLDRGRNRERTRQSLFILKH